MVLVQIMPDGGMNTIREKGNVEINQKIKEYMGKNIKETPKKFSDE